MEVFLLACLLQPMGAVINPGPKSHTMMSNPTDELPEIVTRTLNQGSVPISMDFHPIQLTLLLGWFPRAFFFLMSIWLL
jgi:hypothetical protein